MVVGSAPALASSGSTNPKTSSGGSSQTTTTLSKKNQALAKKLASAPALPSSKGQDPTLTVVEKKKDDDQQSGRPDKAAYDAEQDKLRTEIDALQLKVNDLRTKISSTSQQKGGPQAERKAALRAELDTLRTQQATLKGGRGKTLETVKTLQDSMGKKIKDLQAAKAKSPYKSVTEVDHQIKALERSVETGTMKLVDEKKALSEISVLRKSRKAVESFAAQQTAIDADKKKVDEIRAGLDDPESKSISDQFSKVRAELDQINKEHDEASKGRDVLFEERNVLSKQLDGLFTQKKESAAAFREANNKFYQKMNDDRQKRIERQRAELLEYEDKKRAEINQNLLEEAQAPAFEREIEDCSTLINFFQRRIGVEASSVTAPTFDRSSGSGSGSLLDKVPKLELRKVEAGPPEGGVALKKKGEQDEEVWGGLGKKKKGGKKAPAGGEGDENAQAKPAANQALNLPFGTLSALLTLGIPSPTTVADVSNTISALELKKKYFVDNQDRVTKEKIAAAEKRIAQAEAKSSTTSTPVSNGEGKTNGAAASSGVEATDDAPLKSVAEKLPEKQEDKAEKAKEVQNPEEA